MYDPRRPAPCRGTYASSRTSGWDAVPKVMPDARHAQTTGMLADVKSQRPDTPMLVSPAQCAPAQCRGMVANKPGAPGRLRINVKTPRRECRMLGCTCGTCRLHFFRRRAMGEAFTRHSLHPLGLSEGELIAELGLIVPRECERMPMRSAARAPSPAVVPDKPRRASARRGADPGPKRRDGHEADGA
ncbi:hypothetical protein BRADO3231 [Bradyrhizobium sp. ORS 278]|nr:hypothetical protein BRADO3231 [Bradyrhizobium sp. ORS 278]